MQLVKLGGKGQGLADATDDGAIVLRHAGVYPIEIYSDDRIASFLEEDRNCQLNAKQLSILADESCDFSVIRALRQVGYSVKAIAEIFPSLLDEKVCRITYQALMQKKAKTYHVKPLKIFSYRDTMYLHARLGKEPGKVYREPDFDPLLAIHRLKKVEMTDRGFEYPTDYNFEDIFDKNFGFMKDDCFEVEVELTG